MVNQRHVHLPVACPFCHIDDETDQHVLLTCNYSRAVWFGSPLTIRSDSIQLPNIKEGIKECSIAGKNKSHI